jgi:hypothetical protein
VPGAFGRERAPAQRAAQSDGEVADVDHLLDFTASLAADLPGFKGDDGCEIVDVLAKQRAQVANHFRAPGSRSRSPTRERARRSVDRIAHARDDTVDTAESGAGDRRAGGVRAAIGQARGPAGSKC